jgi:hypothetical protein
MNPVALGASIAFCMVFGALATLAVIAVASVEEETRIEVVVPIRIPHPVQVERR